MILPDADRPAHGGTSPRPHGRGYTACHCEERSDVTIQLKCKASIYSQSLIRFSHLHAFRDRAASLTCRLVIGGGSETPPYVRYQVNEPRM